MIRFMYHLTWVIVVIFCAWTSTSADAQSVLYVDADAVGANDGSSWADAFTELQSALAVAQADDEIRVAQGTYKPDYDVGTGQHTGDRGATFSLINGVALYGGYAGLANPDNPDERDLELFETTLSGDLNGDDVPDFAGFLACLSGWDHPYEPGCEPFDLDGDGDVDTDDGHMDENSYHVVMSGEGIDGTAILDGFTITRGWADEWGGDKGGGMLIGSSTPTVTRCTFAGNVAVFAGGGMDVHFDGDLTVTDCVFRGNVSTFGGGMFTYAYVDEEDQVILVNCLFDGNRTIKFFLGWPEGGGMDHHRGKAALVNCTFSGNSADPADPGSDGGGIYRSDLLLLVNSIFWDNTATHEPQIGGYGDLAVIYSDIQGGWTGEGNIDEDPLFVDPDGPDDDPDTWEDNDHHLSSGSPCIDAGFSALVSSFTDTDLDGNPRRIDDPDTPDTGMGPYPIVDMGAYEYFPDCNNNGIPDICDCDCDALGGTCNVPGCGQSPDCNTNGIPDECDIAEGTSQDCQPNGVPDECDIAEGTSQDCQPNTVPDECDIAEGTSLDDDSDSVPDECDNCDLYNPDQADCQPNGVGDVCDIAYGTSDDDNDNDIPDECERRRPMAEDCATIAPGTRCDVDGGADPCLDDDDCANESHCVLAPVDQPGLGNVCYAPKTRYLSIARNPEQVAITARRVKLDEGTLLGWVGAPTQDLATGLWLANIVADPVSVQTWPDVVHVWGCEIAHANLSNVTGKHCKPNTIAGENCVEHCYIVQASSDGVEYSEELVLCTTSTWGDMCGIGAGGLRTPPDAVYNLADILAAIGYFQGDTGIAPLTWLDIAPSFGTGIPDQNVGVADVSGFVSGFQGSPYPGLGPLGCSP